MKKIIRLVIALAIVDPTFSKSVFDIKPFSASAIPLPHFLAEDNAVAQSIFNTKLFTPSASDFPS